MNYPQRPETGHEIVNKKAQFQMGQIKSKPHLAMMLSVRHHLIG